jgi:hypothetical protein
MRYVARESGFQAGAAMIVLAIVLAAAASVLAACACAAATVASRLAAPSRRWPPGSRLLIDMFGPDSHLRY